MLKVTDALLLAKPDLLPEYVAVAKGKGTGTTVPLQILISQQKPCLKNCCNELPYHKPANLCIAVTTT